MTYLLLFLAVAIGYVMALLLKAKKTKSLPIFLAFSGAFLLAVTIFELLPEVYQNPSKEIGVYVIGGILLQIFLEFFSQGAEHGHVHEHNPAKSFPWLLFVSLSIHALLEGFPISDDNNLLIGVMVHKIPIALILSLFFIKANYKKTTTISFLFLFALMTPLGNWLSEHLIFTQDQELKITAVTIGVFLHVSTTILFESSKNHKFNVSKMSAVVIAILIAYFM
ncbi:MAG: ZIP family metal transporter [Flavobacteriaceae bacterium]|nr:ZIP family metal transporter [Flavobacteriaceae bacterium]